MESADYVKHFKALGKMARIHDLAAPDVSTQQLLIARLFDQVATGETAELDALLILDGQANALANAVSATTNALRTAIASVAAAYLVSSYFRDDLTTTPTQPTSPASVLNALATDMGAGVNNVTLSTQSGTGFVNFFVALGATAAWNTEADGTADYKDSVYVVSTIV